MGISLNHFDIFEGISDSDIQIMQKSMLQRLIQKNQSLNFGTANQYVYFLLKGRMKLITANEHDQQLIKNIVQPGSFLGDILFFESLERENAFAKSIESSTVGFMPLAIILEWMVKYQPFRLLLKQIIAHHIIEMEDRLLAVIYKPAEQRIIDFLVRFVTEYGTMDETVWKVKKYITDTDICQFVATSRQTVSHVMNELRDHQLISYDSRTIEIPVNSSLLTNRFLNHL